MTVHSKIGEPAVRVGGLAQTKTHTAVAQDREDAKAAASARRELRAGTFDGVSLDALEADLRKGR